MTSDTATDTTDVPTDNGDTDLSFDSPDDALATVVTNGDPLRSSLDFLAVLVDEAQFHFTTDGIEVTAVDPANVGMVSFDGPASAWSGYDSVDDDLTVGMPLTTSANHGLMDVLKFARKGYSGQNGDPVRIDIIDGDRDPRVRVQIIRPDQNLKRSSEFHSIDPDSMRQEPDIPDLDGMTPNQAQPDLDGLAASVKALKRSNDYTWLARRDHTLVVGTQPTPNPSLKDIDDSTLDDIVDTVTFPTAAWSEDDSDAGDGSIFSMDYLSDAVTTAKASKADRVNIRFGDEVPLKMAVDWTDWGFDGQFMLAPRIMNDDTPGV